MALRQVESPAGNGNHHHHKDCQQTFHLELKVSESGGREKHRELPSCFKCSVKFHQSSVIWGATPFAGVDPLSCFMSRVSITIYQEILEPFMLVQKLLLSEKSTLGHRAMIQFYFYFSSDNFLTISMCGDFIALQPQSTFCEAPQVLESALLHNSLTAAVIPVACVPFLPHFSLPVNITLISLIQHCANNQPCH